MAHVLLHTAEEPVTLSALAARRLLERGDGDAALLYLALLRHQGNVPPRSLAGELRWPKDRLDAAEGILGELGLIGAPAEQVEEQPEEERPAYQQSDIAERLEGGGDFPLLTAEVERRLGKKLTTPELGVLLGLYEHLGLPADVVYLLVCHCADRTAARYGTGRRPTMRQIEKEGYAWLRRGIDTQAAAAEYLKRCALREREFAAYMRVLQLGDRAPVASEEKYLSAWQEMGFSPEAVAIAFDKTVLHCHEFKWAYCQGILKRWHKAGLHTAEEIEAGDRPAPRRAPPPSSSTAATEDEIRRYAQELRRSREGQ